jgi:hypothetical protein
MLKGAIGAETIGAVCIADNDLVPEPLIDPVKQRFTAENRLKSLYRVSDLEKVWRWRSPQFGKDHAGSSGSTPARVDLPNHSA